MSTRIRVAGAAAFAVVAALAGGAPAWAASNPTYTYDYSYPDQGSFTSAPGEGLCGTAESVTIDGTFSIHLVTALPGLTADDVLALWNNEGRLADGSPAPITHFGYRESADFVDQTPSHTYSGSFSDGFVGNGTANGTRFLSTGTFVARGTSETGSAFRVTSGGPSLSSETAQLFDHEFAHVTGCLPES